MSLTNAKFSKYRQLLLLDLLKLCLLLNLILTKLLNYIELRRLHIIGIQSIILHNKWGKIWHICFINYDSNSPIALCLI